MQATNGNLYGTTIGGGPTGGGTVFKITPGGTLTTLYSFCSQSRCTDGQSPYAALIQANDGNFYGTTYIGGADGYGTVFKITPSGTLTTLHSFDVTGGPSGSLVQATDGNFYGTTTGAFDGGLGTVFKITPSGTLTTLHSFDGTDGYGPYAGLVQGTDGNFYGTTFEGGVSNGGTIFRITPGGMLTTLWSFNEGFPYGGVIQGTNGMFYGTTEADGANGIGTVFSLSVSLGPFVETRPTSGKVATAVEILGTNLTGTTSVTFNGTAAAFAVVSGTEIKTTVPSGATTGKVKVTTPTGTLSSNVPFRVQP